MDSAVMEGLDKEGVFAMDNSVYCEGIAKSLLPEGHDYKFEKIDVISELDENGEIQVDIVGRVNVQTVEEVKTFLGEFYSSSGSSFNIKSGRADRKRRKDVEIHGYRKCIMQVHQTNPKRPKCEGLHQDCPAEINFRLEKPKTVLPRDSAELIDRKNLALKFPMWFNIKYRHNHEINRQDHKRFRTVGQETKESFVALFEEDLTPSAAWEQHRKNIQMKYPEDYSMKFGDRHICPDYFWVFRFYRKWIGDTLGSYDGVDAYMKTVKFVKDYNEKTKASDPLDEGINIHIRYSI